MKNRFCQTPLLCLLLTGLVFIAACNTNSPDNSTENLHESRKESHEAASSSRVTLSRQQFHAAGIEIGKIRKIPLGAILPVNGMVDVPPQSKVSVSFPYGGFVRKINVLEGDYVKKGSLLAILENPEYVDLQESYLKSKSQLEYAEQEYERQRTLYQADVAAGKSYQKATSEYRSLEASVAAIAQKLRLLGIRSESLKPGTISATVHILAPESGYITKVKANLGKYINAQEELMELDNTRDIHIDLTIYEKDLGSVHAGQEVSFTLSGNENKVHKAKVMLVGREVREDRSVVAHAIPADQDKNYIPGTYVQAKIRLDAAASDAVPQDAVVRSEGKQYIFVPQSGENDSFYHFQMVPVTIGLESNGYTQVQLPAGAGITDSSVVTKGAFSLLSALKNTGEE